MWLHGNTIEEGCPRSICLKGIFETCRTIGETYAPGSMPGAESCESGKNFPLFSGLRSLHNKDVTLQIAGIEIDVRLFLLTSTALLSLSSVSSAGDFYAGLRAGLVSPLDSVRDVDSDTWEHTFDSSFSGGLFVGSYLGYGLRGELAVDLLHFDTSLASDGAAGDTIVGDATSVAFTASLWRDLPGIGPLTPYVGLGVGIARTMSEYVQDNFNRNGYEGDDFSPVGLAGAGVRFDVTERLTADFGYRFMSVMNTRDIQVLPTTSNQDYGLGNFTSHQFTAGLSYRFGDENNGFGEPPVFSAPTYVGGFFGSTWTADGHVGSDESEQGKTIFANPRAAVGVFAGTEIAPSLRGEIEISYQRSEADRVQANGIADADIPYTGRFNQTFVLANLWQDFGQGPVTAYAGGGLGFAHVGFDVAGLRESSGSTPLSFDGSQGVFAGQFGAGFRYEAAHNLTFDLGYRMRGALGVVLPNALDDSNARVSLYSHTLQLGASYAFGASDEDGETVKTDNDSYVSAAIGTAFHPVGEMFANQTHPLFFDAPVSLSLAYGHRLTDNLRAEVELGALLFDGGSTRDDAADDVVSAIDGGVAQFSVMTNYWADLDLGLVQPYAGGGFGLALTSTDLEFAEGASTTSRTVLDQDFAPSLALQAGLGVRVPVTESVLFDVGYRYRTAVDVFSNGTRFDGFPDRQPGTITYESHGVQVGLTWELPH